MNRLADNILKGFKAEIHSAVGVVFDSANNILIGLSNATDDRQGKWVFLGGGVDEGESPLQTSIREVYEEGGVVALPIALPMIIHPSKPMVAFLVLKCNEEKPPLQMNDEFYAMKWAPLNEVPKEMMLLNIEMLKMIEKNVIHSTSN
jgi:8-oxo-dGTP pyrophosphatase MutT (NUDIX family)